MPIRAVTLAIKDLLVAALHDDPDIPADAFDVFVGPPDRAGSGDELILFLLRVTPTPELRNAERVRPAANPTDPPLRFARAVPLDLHYLVAAGASAILSHDQALSHLADAVRAIETGSPIALAGKHQEAVWLSLEPMTTEELSRIWGLFPNFNGRTSFTFRASPVWIEPRVPQMPAPPVIDDRAHSVPIAAGS